MALIDNIVSYWKFDEISGNAADSAGSNTLTNNNAVTYVPAKIANGANILLASSQSLTISDGSQSGLDLNSNFTFNFWVALITNPTSGNIRSFLSKWTDSGNQRAYTFLLLNNAGTLQLDFRWTSNGAATESRFSADYTPPTDGTFVMVTFVGTIGTPAGQFYVNGSPLTTSTILSSATSIFNSTAPFGIGLQDTNAELDAVMDEVGVWARELTGVEVAQLYNGGSGLTYPFMFSTKPNFLMLFS